jgi:hypothetical protein
MSIDYPKRQEKIIKVEEFYHLRPELDMNLKYGFWHAVALLLQQHYLRRDRQARRFAWALFLVRRTAAERDAALRQEIAYWKAEAARLRGARDESIRDRDTGEGWGPSGNGRG